MPRPPIHPRRLLHAVHRWLQPQVTVTVWLNDDSDAISVGFRPGARLVLAYRYTLPAATTGTDSLLLERVFAAFNGEPVHPDDERHADAWPTKGLRSLSVGDIVAIDNRYYACESVGWTPIPAPRT
ncbi:hypothetical protein ABZ540_33890 [Nocardia xishanensis]|uniref:hypothetical protein n=1 Tax=Nocardia xishanensis TaxID=238964 RepID=UPI0033C4F537